MAFGLNASGVKNEADPTFALVNEHIDSNNTKIRHAAILALSFAYAGSYRSDLLEKLLPLVLDTNQSIQTCALAALGHIFVSSRNEEVATGICQALMERPEN